MPAPLTTGKLCTATSQMAVGDIIKCVYEAPTANVAGYFSQLGVLEPKLKVINISKNGEDDPNPTVTESYQTYAELPTTPGTTPSGFFYLLKADDGLLIADRMVQSQISWESINKKNYVYGGVCDVANSATIKTITTTTETHDTISGETAGTTTNTVNHFDQSDRAVITTSVTKTIAAVPDTSVTVEEGEEQPTKNVTTIVTTETKLEYAKVIEEEQEQGNE